MKRAALAIALTLILLILFAVIAEGKTKMGASQVPYEGWVAGAGVGSYWFASNWYWYESGGYVGSREHWPRHIFSGALLTAFIERRSLLMVGPFAFGARVELHYGLTGGTKEDWLSNDGRTISNGGARVGAGMMAEFAYPIRINPTTVIAPFPGIGVQFFSLNANGKGVYEDISGLPYNYNHSWTESMLIIPLSLGVAIELNEKFVLTPEYRFLIGGGAWTDWEPAGYAPADEGPNYSAFMIRFGVKLQ